MVAAAARTAGLAVVIAAGAAASVLGIAAVADAAPGSPSPTLVIEPEMRRPRCRRAVLAPTARYRLRGDGGGRCGRRGHRPRAHRAADHRHGAKHPEHGAPGPVWHPGGPTDNRDLPALLARRTPEFTRPRRSALPERARAGAGQRARGGRRGERRNPLERAWQPRSGRPLRDSTGIDTKAGVVHLNDSGNNAGRDEQVSLASLENSWATSHNFVVITN